MRSFKQFITEAKGPELAPWHLRGEELKNYIENEAPKALSRRCRIKRNDTLTITGDIGLNEAYIKDGHLPFQIDLAKSFSINSDNLTSLWGCPSRCDDFRVIADKLKTLEHLNCEITGVGGGKGYAVFTTRALEKFDCWLTGRELVFHDLMMPSLHNIHKNFDFHRVSFQYGIKVGMPYIKSDILGLLLMPSLKSIGYSAKANLDADDDDFYKAGLIIVKHLQHEKDLLDCKEELMTAGLKDYAKI